MALDGGVMAAEINISPILISNQAWNFALLLYNWLAGQKISTFETTPVGIHCFHSDVVMTARFEIRGISEQRGAADGCAMMASVTKDPRVFAPTPYFHRRCSKMRYFERAISGW